MKQKAVVPTGPIPCGVVVEGMHELGSVHGDWWWVGREQNQLWKYAHSHQSQDALHNHLNLFILINLMEVELLPH